MPQLLKERIINCLKLSREGLSVIGLENEFKESRMRVGFIIKQLEEEGIVIKKESTYIIAPDNKI
jgi:DNA-binding GntR family transcriptional regulator